MASKRKPEDRLVARSTSGFSFEDEDDGIAMEDDDDGIGACKGLTCERSPQVFESSRDLLEEENRLIAEAVDCTGVSEGDAFLLLRHFGWEVASFNEAFFEDPEATRRRTGVSEDTAGGRRPFDQLCGICFSERGESFLPCANRPLRRQGARGGTTTTEHPVYCRDCWRQYLEHAVQEGKNCLSLRCPAPGCGEAVRRSVFEQLLHGAPKERFRRFSAESLVDDSRGRARWCPGQRCGRATREPASETREVKCPCGTVWCFGCGTDAHLPVTCETVSQWEKKNRDESEDATWIKVNTKSCPKCQRGIEKNGGCMHMTCQKPGGCGYEFCWICMKPWIGHSNCNATPVDQQAEQNKALAKSEILRYGHFYERYLAHHKAENFAATDQLQGMEAVASALCASRGFKVSDVAFLRDAVLQIRSCRRFLKWTYAHAYFAQMSKDERRLFEFQQGQLEGTLERLCDVMENTEWDTYLSNAALSHAPFYALRGQLISLTGVVRQFFDHLREALQQGTLWTGVVSI